MSTSKDDWKVLVDGDTFYKEGKNNQATKRFIASVIMLIIERGVDSKIKAVLLYLFHV